MTTQRRLNSTYADKIGRDGAPKLIHDTFAPATGMRNRTAEQSLVRGFSNPLAKPPSTVDDRPLQKTYEGKNVPVHPSMAHRDTGSADLGSKVLHEAARLGGPPEKA
jgi:hypothetical protein